MKHYYVTGYRQLEVVEEPMPTPGAGEVVVQIAYTALSPGSNVSAYLNQSRQQRGELLYMASGVVQAVGEGVQQVAPGDAVAAFLGATCPDLILETSGAWQGFHQALELARDYTRLVIMGIYRQPPPPELGLDLHQLLYSYPSKFH